jgi:hypothetical protein
MGRKTSKSYSLKEAMFDAKKIYKKGKNSVMSMGKQTRRRASSKKGYSRKRMYKGGTSGVVPAEASGSSMLSKFEGSGSNVAAAAKVTEAPLSAK